MASRYATFLSQWNYTLRDIEYFGGVVMFTGEQFENINGYHMDYWGWGMEDDDLFWRCVRKGYYYEIDTCNKMGQGITICIDSILKLQFNMWDFKNKHYYQWVKQYQDKWTKVNLKSDTDKSQILFTINDKVLDGQFGIQKSKIRYRDRLKRYGRVPFYIGCNSPQSWGGQRFFKGEIAEIKIKNQYDELLLH